MADAATSTGSRLAALRPTGGLGWAQLFATGFFVLEAVAALGLLLWYQARILRFPYPINYVEGPVLDLVVRLASAQNPYPADLATAPFHVAVYPPFYAILQAPFVWAFGPALWYGRLLSIVGVFAAAISCAWMLRSLTGDRLAAACGGALLLACPYLVHWSPLVLVDSLGLGLSLVGLCIVVCGRGRRAASIVAALCFVAAAYTRQSAALAAPFAAFVWLWRSYGARAAFELAAWTAAPGLATLELSTAGGFWLNVVGAHEVSFEWATVLYWARDAVFLMPLLLLATLAYCLVGSVRREAAWCAFTAYGVMSVAVAASIGKFGSGVNYLFEPVASFALATAALLAGLRARPALRALLLLGPGIQLQLLIVATLRDADERDLWKLDREPEIARLAQPVDASEGPVLADEWMALIPLAGRPVVFMPFAFSALAWAEAWDEAPFLEALDREDYALILLYEAPDWPSIQTRWTTAMIESVREHYYFEERIGHTLVVRPGDPPLR